MLRVSDKASIAWIEANGGEDVCVLITLVTGERYLVQGDPHLLRRMIQNGKPILVVPWSARKDSSQERLAWLDWNAIVSMQDAGDYGSYPPPSRGRGPQVMVP